ncbi:MAG: hypothetical protein Q7U54_08680 [Bacteroidales bacterium]|nr:hypothetical protein [Bacteroidales bacterium]
MVPKLLYREEQSFRQTIALWLMLATIILLVGGFGVGFYQQLYLGRPYGEEPMSNNGLIWSSIVSFVVVSTIFIFILNGSLVTEIWSDGIRYKFTPLIRKMRHIPLDEIIDVKVEKYKPIVEFGGWGWRRRLLTRKTAYNVSGTIGIRVTLKNRSQIVFGTHQQEEMKRAVEKMVKSKT